MAYTFAKTPSHSYLRTTTGPPQWGRGVDRTGFSVSLWFNAANATAAHTLLKLEHGGTNTRYLLNVNGATADDPVIWRSQIGEYMYTVSQTSYTASTWQHVFASAEFSETYTTLSVALNGALICAENEAAIAPTDAESYVQISGDNVFIPAIDGAIAEVAIYDVDLSAAPARFELADGFAPSRVMPQNLIFYAPLVRDLQDVKAGHTLTAYNSPTPGPHCPVRRPANSFPARCAPYVPSVTGSSWYYNRKRRVA